MEKPTQTARISLRASAYRAWAMAPARALRPAAWARSPSEAAVFDSSAVRVAIDHRRATGDCRSRHYDGVARCLTAKGAIARMARCSMC
jgi:hypothetical protein